ncbi:DUF1016 N-terminal domain-containing protein [Rhizobium sp. CCGE 510]|uniref:DUF1016 N-terminal domain-containing protein n=1 Tax=Rhizobium sp. CCGE 510 TaxID=1132836 RepID=UPI0023E84057|nr:DUF1016 N-terminal domain-containing protein [Rhizobium sp. CCGE 510]
MSSPPGWSSDRPRNLKYMRAFTEAFPDEEIVQQLVAHLPWGHNELRVTNDRRSS